MLLYTLRHPMASLRTHLPSSMAAPVNNIAATFSAKPSPPISLPRSSLASASWNPHHTSLSLPHKSSLLDLYGPPAPLPIRPISARRSPPLRPCQSISTSIGSKLPGGVLLSYVDCSGVVRSVGLGGICRGKRRAVVVGVSAAFSPGCARFLRRVESAEACRGAEVVACVAGNDAFVMGAWGESLGVDGGKWKMLSDGLGELWRELGLWRHGRKLQRFWLSASNGIITHLSLDDDGDAADQRSRED